MPTDSNTENTQTPNPEQGAAPQGNRIDQFSGPQMRVSPQQQQPPTQQQQRRGNPQQQGQQGQPPQGQGAPEQKIQGVTPRTMATYNGWGSKRPKIAKQGTAGGSVLIAKIGPEGPVGPSGHAAIVSAAALSGTVKPDGPNTENARQYTRQFLSERGALDSNQQLTLADGTKVDMSTDESKYVKGLSNRALATAQGGNAYRKLKSYEVDYTNDATFISTMAGVSLTRILTGTTAKAAEQLGGQIANGCVSNVDTKGDLTQKSYNKIMTNYRSVYANAGITSKSEAYILSNQMYAEGRINDMELVQMQRTFDMIYNENSWAYAQTVLEGKGRGIKLANEKRTVKKNNSKKKKGN